ncbi:MAG: DUF1761 domain-containing protein [Steroidobacter sp.]
MNLINLWAVLVAAASSFALGGLWYSPLMFYKLWNREAGRVESTTDRGHPARVFGVAFVFSFIAAAAFAWWLGPDPELSPAVVKGLTAGACFVGASFGVNYQFANRSWLLWLIDAGYHTAQFALFAIVLAPWP